MRKCLTLLLVFVASTAVVAGEDWRTDIFDRAQALVAAKNRKFMALVVEVEPRLADWCGRATAREDAKQRASRYAFVKLLREKPDEIASEKPADWVRILDVLNSPALELLRADPVFLKLANEYGEKRRTSGGLNPPIELFEPIQEKIATESTLKIEVELAQRLGDLADEVAKKKKANQAAELTAPSGRSSP
jgi:hypothetical protein